ncbi:FAD-dependent oxidoreductase [Sporosarcina saromensis]|uniref:FAD-dependent oxidoreductase n=1 Tax=Sporosarcina saromensis TaxID=359365 RepID=A0ABU4G637_9BACL|nr:FAD-dependent oxidoreductase [Sporosarcina saromensis]MDW0112424.1 FAD-dependent oxidoreductase [Sporosarcina saromensis]
MGISNLHYYVPTQKVDNQTLIEKELIIYGGTPAGLTAAVQAKRMGITVAIVEFSKNIGGMTASGLGATDLGAEDAVGGLSREFYQEIAKYYHKEKQWTFEPKAAQFVFNQWMRIYDIPVYLYQHLAEVTVENQQITEIVMENGARYSGKIFMDCSYEGDLLAKSGVSYFVGREYNATYQEIYNGIQFGAPHHKFEKWIDPYVVEGQPKSGVLPGITEDDREQLGYQGQGDHRIQAYNFRICLTKDPENKLPFPKPAHYDDKRYGLLLRYIQSGVWDAMKLHTMLPNGKSDLNNYGAISTDHIGMNYDWPEGSYQRREEIFQDHVNYDMGMLYFLANDSRVPDAIRQEVNEWGLPKDEFIKTGNWPHQLYIRESRRMISEYVMTDRNCLQQTFVDDSIGLASFHMDSHNCRRVVIDGRCVNEGDVQVPIGPYEISYRSIRPKATECTNLLVPVCLSSSHIAYGSIRMEPIFMILGQSAGVAAALAIQHETTVQDVNYEELKQELLKANQVVRWGTGMVDDPIKRMEETFGK